MAEKIETPSPEQHKTTQQEIDLLDLINKTWAARREIIKYGVVGGIVGLIIALSIPKEYTCTVKMAPEGKGIQSGGGMSSLAAMAGINMTTQTTPDAITTALYPEVISSTPFLLELSQIKLTSPKIDTTITLFDYARYYTKRPWWSIIPAIPSKTIGGIKSLFTEKKTPVDTINPFQLTGMQEGVLGNIGSRLAIQTDKKSGLINLVVEFQDPYITALVADSSVALLERYIRSYRTEKATRDYLYNEQLYVEAREKYYSAQTQDAVYADAMRNISLESVRIERERLSNEKMLAYQVYAQATTRMEMSRAKIQEDTPSAAVIEPARVPVRDSNRSMVVYIFIFAFLSSFILVGKIFIKTLFNP